MASNNEINSILNSCNDKTLTKKHLNEHEETIKSDQMASKKSLSNDGEEQIASMDEHDLKNLLDEALTYKNPRDANEKSETFKRLLQNVTEEEEHKRKFESNSLHWKAQSNSLQNLLDESHYQLPNHQSQISSKKHQQRRKNSTSVSTRRLEGGSLPVDMHHSSSAIQSPPDQPFLSEFKNKKRKDKLFGVGGKDTVIDMADIDMDDRKSFQRCFDSNKDTTPGPDIEMKIITSNRNEIEVQDQTASKFVTTNSTPNTITKMASFTSGSQIPIVQSSKASSLQSSVDAPIAFTPLLEKAKSYQQAQIADHQYYPSTTSTINHSNNILLTPGGSSSSGADQSLQMVSGMALESVMNPNSYPAKHKTSEQSRDHVSSLIQTTPTILPASHSSTTSNSKDSKASKKRTAKSERNEKKINVTAIEGYRGYDTVETLLNYIDGQHNNNNSSSDGKAQKNHPKNGIVSNNNSCNDKQTSEQLLNADADKKKNSKIVTKNKEKMNKLKKSNSMDELCSTGRQKEKEKSVVVDSSTANKIVQDVTLRSKTNNNSSMTSGAKKVEGNSKTEKSQAKRNERRSWGTEGLWPDTSSNNNTNNNNNTNEISIPKSSENQDDHHENESSSSSSSGVQLDFTTTTDPLNNLTSNFESINASSEADKFQVVIKKKKVKRKSSDHPEIQAKSASNNLQSYANRRDANLRSGTKTNNDKNTAKNSTKIMSQDAKQNSIGSKNRRKSTSSMPPSDEDGEYSDGGDSVQSLPIETTKTTSSLLSAPSSNISSAENSGKTIIKHNNNTTTNKYDKNSSANSPATATIQHISPSQQHHTTIQQIQQQKPTTFSYADIAKTNTNRTNNNNNNNVIPASTEKMWPSISSSSLSTTTHQNNNTINTNNNVNDPFAISNFDAISNNSSNLINNNININNSNVNASNNAANPSKHHNQQQQHQIKSTPPIKNTMSFPELVESNNNRNKQLSNSPLDMSTNGDATQTEKPSINGLERAFDNNNNPSTTINTTNTQQQNDRNSNKISYSQSLIENHHHHHELDSNGNSNAKIDNAITNVASTVASNNKNMLTKSKSVEHNNLSSIEHYPALEKTKQTLSDVLSKPIESLSTKTKVKNQNQQQVQQTKSTVEMTTTLIKDENGNGTKKKKDKLALKKSTSTVSTSTSNITSNEYSSNNININNNNNNISSHARPAVIILNDCEKSSDMELGITFGFDINEHLLFGHQNGDVVADIDNSVEIYNCDIMNTNLSSNNINNVNLTNQSCGFEIYDNFISSPPPQTHQSQQNCIIDHTQMMQHPVTIIQSSPKIINSNNNSIKENTIILDTSNQSSNDLGYLSSSLITNSASSPANQKISNDIQHQQMMNSDNQYENEYGHPTSYPIAMDIKQRLQLDELISRYVSPEPAKNFNYDELVTFVSEEWTKVERNGVVFNDDIELCHKESD